MGIRRLAVRWCELFFIFLSRYRNRPQYDAKIGEPVDRQQNDGERKKLGYDEMLQSYFLFSE